MAKSTPLTMQARNHEKDIEGSLVTQISEEPDNYQAKGVCKIILNPKGSGTGFLGTFMLNNKPMRGLFTNNHVLDEFYLKQKTSFTLDFQNDTDDSSIKKLVLPRDGVDLSFVTCPFLDATFIEFDQTIIDDLAGAPVEYLPLIDEKDEIRTTDPLTVIGFPCNKYNGTKHIARGDLHKFNGFNLLHKVSTNPGSSGSPVFTTDGKVVGLHKAASQDDCNVAVSIVAVRKAIEIIMGKKGSQDQADEEMHHDLTFENLGLTERFNHCKPLKVYSFTPNDRKFSEKWLVCSGHGWYWTDTNPCKVDLDMIFHSLNWVPLKQTDFMPDKDGRDLCELAEKLVNLKLRQSS